jgi:hypothetical protein
MIRGRCRLVLILLSLRSIDPDYRLAAVVVVGNSERLAFCDTVHLDEFVIIT